MEENIIELKKRRKFRFLMVKVAIKAKVKFDRIYKRNYGAGFDRRHTQFMQKAFTFN